MAEATEAQIRYAKKLLNDLGYDFDVMTRKDVSELIDNLSDELGIGDEY